MSWSVDNLDLVVELTLNHMRLSVIPIVLAFVIAVPLGWLANRNRTLRAVTITTGSVLYTIPSLSLFVILLYVLGTRVLSEVNLVVALLIYSVAVMGFSAWSPFWSVEFPLAGPVLLAGMRVVSVSTIALVSVVAVIGVGGLGYLFLNGRQRNNLEEILVGIAASVLIALVFDLLLVALGRLVIPSTLAGAYLGIESVDRVTVDAARASGMSELQILTKVEIPLALPLIVGAFVPPCCR